MTPQSKLAAEMADALRKLVFMAHTSGGVAGRDESLCKACDRAEAALAKYDSAQSAPETREVK